MTMGHSGGPDSADIRYVPEKQLGVAVHCISQQHGDKCRTD